MFHRLYEPPSIPLRFTLAGVLPRRRDSLTFLGWRFLFETRPEDLSSLTAWTTGVSNPIRSPRFRPSRSGFVSIGAFASGVPSDLYVFYHSTRNSPIVYKPRSDPLEPPRGSFPRFEASAVSPSTDPLRPVFSNNTRPLRITAAAGTKLAGAFLLSVLFTNSLASFTIE